MGKKVINITVLPLKFNLLNLPYLYVQSSQLSNEFIEEFKDNLIMDKDSYMYKSTDFIKAKIIATGLYDCHDDYFIAYKGIRNDRYSAYNFQYQYLKGNTYEAHADFTDAENSFGLSVWTKNKAIEYCNKLVVTCKVYYKDVARLVHGSNKIRCTKITILD